MLDEEPFSVPLARAQVRDGVPERLCAAHLEEVVVLVPCVALKIRVAVLVLCAELVEEVVVLVPCAEV